MNPQRQYFLRFEIGCCVWWTFSTLFCYHRKLSMVFKVTITIEWNGWGQPLGSMVFRWFWGKTTIGNDGFRWLCTIGPTMYHRWSLVTKLMWKSRVVLSEHKKASLTAFLCSSIPPPLSARWLAGSTTSYSERSYKGIQSCKFVRANDSWLIAGIVYLGEGARQAA